MTYVDARGQLPPPPTSRKCLENECTVHVGEHFSSNHVVWGVTGPIGNFFQIVLKCVLNRLYNVL